MKRLQLLLIFTFPVVCGYCQNLTGTWTGTSNFDDSKTRYNIEIDIVQSGVQLKGRVKASNGSNYVIENFTGSIAGTNLLMNEFKVVECSWPSANWRWELKRFDGELVINDINNTYVVDGVWSSSHAYYKDSTIKEIPKTFGSFTMNKATGLPPNADPVITKSQTPDPANGQSKSISDGPAGAASKQPKPFERPLDGYYKKSSIIGAHVTPYQNLRETDVAFSKRVWRDIDVREKMNQYLVSPKGRLIDVLMTAIDAGELTAYDPNPSKDDPNGDSFAIPLTPGKARSRFADSAVVDQFDKDGNKIGSRLVPGEFNPDSIVRFRIKEDWIFDKQRSIFEPRIIGLAPLMKLKAAGVETDFQPAFWIYFPEARQVLSTKEAVSRNNDATGLSFDDVFMKRIFASVIVKESNAKDERIKDYAQGIDRVYESERVKKSLMDWELGLWSY